MSVQSVTAELLDAADLASAQNGALPQLTQIIDKALGSGAGLLDLAASVDETCRPGSDLTTTQMILARCAVLARPEWGAVLDEDYVPASYAGLVRGLAAQIGGSSDTGMEILRATFRMGDGARFALAGMLNPAMQTPPVQSLEWHPELSYPPISAIAMSGEACSLGEVQVLGQRFLEGTEDPSWVVAPLLGNRAVIAWPEWQPMLDYIGQEEPVGTINLWLWILKGIEDTALSSVFGAREAWHDLDLWNMTVRRCLGVVLDDAEFAPEAQRESLEALRDAIDRSSWPAILGLQ